MGQINIGTVPVGNVDTPPAGQVALFVNDNDNLRGKNSDGDEITFSSGQSMSNTAVVNYDLPEDDPSSRSFTSHAAAMQWILDNGNPGADNLWRIILPPGTTSTVNMSSAYVGLECSNDTIIESLVCSAQFSTLELFYFMVYDAIIYNVQICDGSIFAAKNCVIAYIEKATESPMASPPNYNVYLNNCHVLGGDFGYMTVSDKFTNTSFMALGNDILNLPGGTFQNCSFQTLDSHAITFGLGDNALRLVACTIDIDLYFLGARIYMYSCNANPFVTIRLDESTLRAYQSNLSSVEFIQASPAISEMHLYATSLGSEIIGEQYGKTYMHDVSRSVRFVGIISKDDLNMAPTPIPTVDIVFENAIPADMYVEELYFVVKQQFHNIASPEPYVRYVYMLGSTSFPNEVGGILIDSKVLQSSTDKNLRMQVALSEMNNRSWSHGYIFVYAALKTIPIEVQTAQF